MGVSEEGHAQGRRCREVGSTTTSAQQTQRLKLRRADRAVRRAVARLSGCCASSCGIRPCDRWQRRSGAHITAAAQLRVRVRPVVGLIRIPCCAPLRTHLSIDNPRVRASLRRSAQIGHMANCKPLPGARAACLSNRCV